MDSADLDALRTSSPSATLGNFARGSDKLGISRAMASKRIADLEADLGVKLINRTTRSMSLTEAGRELLAAAETMFGLLESAEQDIRSATAIPRGTLARQCANVLRHPSSRPDHRRFPAPASEVSVDLTLDDRVINIVDEGYDVAIRIRNLANSSLTARRLAPARMVVCASPSYLESRGRPDQPQDLTRHDCLVYDYLARQNVWSFVREGVNADIRVNGRLHSNNGDVLVQAAADGLGIMLAPTSIAHEALRSGALLQIMPQWRAVEPGLFAVMPPGRVDVLKVRSFVEHLFEGDRQGAHWDEGLPIAHV